MAFVDLFYGGFLTSTERKTMDRDRFFALSTARMAALCRAVMWRTARWMSPELFAMAKTVDEALACPAEPRRYGMTQLRDTATGEGLKFPPGSYGRTAARMVAVAADMLDACTEQAVSATRINNAIDAIMACERRLPFLGELLDHHLVWDYQTNPNATTTPA